MTVLVIARVVVAPVSIVPVNVVTDPGWYTVIIEVEVTTVILETVIGT